jgi:hypothetical protein
VSDERQREPSAATPAAQERFSTSDERQREPSAATPAAQEHFS